MPILSRRPRSFPSGLALLATCLLTAAGAAAADNPAPPDLSILTAPGTPFADGDSLFCLGDSITQFGGGPTGYVHLLSLAFAGAHPAVTVVNAGVSGHTVPDLQQRLEHDVLVKKPTVVFIYIGINDVWHHGGDLGAPLHSYEIGLRDIIGRIEAVGGIVVLATPTVIGEKVNGGNQLDASLDVFAATARTLAKELDVELCDLRKAFVSYIATHNPDNKDKGVLTRDGVHLGDAGDALVASEAAKSIVAGMPRGLIKPLVLGGDFVGRTTVTIGFHPGPAAKGLVARYTIDGSEPSASSPIYTKPIELTESATVKARAFRDGAPLATIISTVCRKLSPQPAETTAGATVPGLSYSYYEGSFSRLPDFATLTAQASGIAPVPGLAVAHRDNEYALRFSGFISIPTTALYSFGLSSDDGSRLTIDGKPVIEDDGVHAAGFKQTRLPLAAGLHSCTVDYFQGTGGQALEVTWSAPGLAPQPIPASAFVSAKAK